jgi:hypothetical protein
MAIENRDNLRTSVIETLLATFPTARKVVGGVAYMSDVVDEVTGKTYPVELKVTVRNTHDTQRSKAYDLEAEVEKAASRPGRRVADPAKVAERAANKEAAAARRNANVDILRKWVMANLPEEGMIPSKIAEAIPEFKDLNQMQVGGYLTVLHKEGVVTYTLDNARHRVYTLVK